MSPDFVRVDHMPTWVRFDQVAAVFAEHGSVDTVVLLLNGDRLIVQELADDVIGFLRKAARGGAW